MFSKAATLSVFALLLAVSNCHSEDDLFDCTGKVNGPHEDPLDSNAFYVCFDGELIVRSKCDAGEFYDANLKTCTGGSEDNDLNAYSDDIQDDVSEKEIKSNLLNLLNMPLTQWTSRPHRPYPPPSPPQKPPQDEFMRKIINIQVTKNIFPRSLVIIGKANREQKNK